MSLVNEYFLWYRVWNTHSLLKDAQRQIMIDGYEHATSKQMAEYLLNAMDFDKQVEQEDKAAKTAVWRYERSS